MAQYQKIKIAQIDVPKDRIRDLDEAWAATIGEMMAEVGQKTPIRVVASGDRYVLSAGLHRLHGARLVGWSEIEAGIIEPDDGKTAETLRLEEVLENLARKDFNALERCEALSELKRIYEVLHPEAKKGGDRRSQAAKNKAENQMAIFAFCSSAADTTGLSERSIRLAVQIFEGLSRETRERLKGTVYAEKQSDLKSLAVLDADVQTKVLDVVLAVGSTVSSVADALLLIEGKPAPSAADRLFRTVSDSLVKLPKASRSAVFRQHREEILDLAKREKWFHA